jgi:hypothetical protein
VFLISGKDGKISVVRVGTVVAVLGVLVVVGAGVTFLLDQQARRQPLEVESPSSATQVGSQNVGLTERRVQYTVPVGEMTIEQVVDHYNDRLETFGGEQLCERSPREGVYADFEPGTGRVPFQWQCLFDDSGFNATQYTLVRIQPGVFREDSAINTEGMVVIQHEQVWSP